MEEEEKGVEREPVKGGAGGYVIDKSFFFLKKSPQQRFELRFLARQAGVLTTTLLRLTRLSYFAEKLVMAS